VTELADLARQLELSGYLLAAVLVLARVSPLIVLTPFLGGPTLSAAVRTVAAIAVAAAVFPTAFDGPIEGVDAGVFVVLMLKEFVVGTGLGLLASIAFHALSMAGQLVDQARGATMSQLQNPQTGDESSPLASLHLQLGVVLFLLVGGHRAFLAAVAGSYEVIPLLELPLSPSGLGAVALLSAQLVGGAIAAALMLAAPAVTAIMMSDLALGLIGRTAPQLGTYFMAMPLRAALGLTMVLLSLSLIVDEVVPMLEYVVSLARHTMTLLHGAG